MTPDAESRPHCRAHPAVIADRTCARCGTFACASCLSATDACPDCRVQLLATVPPSAGRARWARRWLLMNGGAQFLTSLGLVLSHAMPQMGGALLLVVGAGGLAMLVTFIATVITFLRWEHALVQTFTVLLGKPTFTSSAAMWSWFIPFVNLARPYRQVRELVAGLGGEATVSRANLSAWWGMWIVANIASNLDTRLTGADDAGVVGLIAATLHAGAAVLAWGVVRTTQRALEEKMAEARAGSLSA